MKKIIAMAALLACFQAFAQLTPQEYKAKYERQVRNVGYDGVGVETILNNWESVAPDDPDMRLGRFYYYLYKSRNTEMVPMDQARYLGKAPSVTLKDADGNPVYYFEVVMYDDACFAEALRVIDALVRDYPYELNYRCIKITNLMSYEKEQPVLSASELNDLISMQSSKHPAWTFQGEAITDEDFCSLIQEYCATLYSIGSEKSYEEFNSISVSMSRLYPKETGFLDNQGSYWLVCQRNYKKAISFYDKALKIDPEDAVAIRNKKIAQRMIDQSKSNSKKK